MDEKKKQGTLNGDTKNENGGHKNDELKNLIAGYVAEAIKNEKATWEKDFSDRIVSERGTFHIMKQNLFPCKLHSA